MYLFRKITMTAGLVACMGLCALSQDKPGVTTMAATKFAPLPGLPACMTLSAQRGDPSKGPAVILAKFTSGCSVPGTGTPPPKTSLSSAAKANSR